MHDYQYDNVKEHRGRRSSKITKYSQRTETYPLISWFHNEVLRVMSTFRAHQLGAVLLIIINLHSSMLDEPLGFLHFCDKQLFDDRAGLASSSPHATPYRKNHVSGLVLL